METIECSMCGSTCESKKATALLEYQLCGWCGWLMERTVGSMVLSRNMKILWGQRSLEKRDWIELKAFLNANNIRSILEYGVGLSTELLLLEGCKVFSLECIDFYARMFCRKVGQNVLHYETERGPPELFEKYPFSLIDSPKSGRKKEAKHAVRHTTRFIYMHNPLQDQIDVLEPAGWTPITHLSQYHGYCRFYENTKETRIV